jgi:AraC-like DNA-binding protein
MSRRACGPGIERSEVFFGDQAFSPHRHDTYVIGVTECGVQTFDYRGATHRARRGDAFVLHPDERHDGRPGTADGFGFRSLNVAPETIGRCLGNAPLPFVADPVSRHPGLRRAIEAALAVFAGEPEPLRVVEALAGLAATLAATADGLARRTIRIDRPAMARVEALLAASVRDGASVAALERAAGLDRWQIYRQFRAAYGVSPYRYLAMRRLDRAARAVSTGTGLAVAALDAGFSDQSHLTRRFRAAFGLSPGQWRAACRSGCYGSRSGLSGRPAASVAL